MSAPTWMQRLLGGTRGQIVALLRRSNRTVNDLAAELGLTDNAVRPHLSALERGGLVQRHSVRRGVGKPAHVYHLAPAADALLPNGYAPVLDLMLSALSERMPPAELEALLRDVGRRAASGAGAAHAPGDLRARVQRAGGVLAALGGDAEVEEGAGALVIRGYSCPLSAVVLKHPEACRLAESLVREIVGADVREQCDGGDRPRCCFHVAVDDRSAA